MSPHTTTTSDVAVPIEPNDRRSLLDLANRIAEDADLTDGARTIAIHLLRHAAIQALPVKDYLSPNDCAALVGVSRPLVNRLLDEGRIPFHTTNGGHRKIKRADVEAYLAERDKIAANLAEARRDLRTPAQQAAVELGLTEEQARRLGMS